MLGREALVSYLQNTEGTERNFEEALAVLSKAGDQGAVQSLFSDMSKKAQTQHERLRKRLEALGGSPSTAKSPLGRLLAFTPTMARIGRTEAEKNREDLVVTYAAASAGMAMYEALAAVSDAAGDRETERLARELQNEERRDREQAWNLLHGTAVDAIRAAVEQGA